jgi:drug/metabolite transporter (DMT)-like permease
MEQRGQPALGLGIVTALLWGPHYVVVQGLKDAGVPGLTLQFHLLLWPALVAWGLLLLGGRKSELAIFQRRQTYFVILAGFGGYGFWVLRGLALDGAGGADCRYVFYAAPLIMGGGALLSRDMPPRRAVVGLLLGFVGCVVMAKWGTRGGTVVPFFSRAGLLGLAAAACWAAFSLMAPQVMRESRPLPVIALVTGIGVVCVLITAVSMREKLFQIRPAQVGHCALAGILTIGLMMGFWLRCLNAAQPVRAGTLWYLGMLAGTLWGLWRTDAQLSWWPFVTGAFLIAVSIYLSPGADRPRATATMGDVIRSSV